MEFIKNQISENRPHLSRGSITTYCSVLRNLAYYIGKEGCDKETFENSVDEILEYVNKLEPKVRKTKLAALIVYYDTPKKSKSDEKLLEKLRVQMKGDIKTYQDGIDTQEKDEKQEENWISWPEIEAKYKQLEKEVAPILTAATQGKLIKNQILMYQMYVLLSCYILIPPRRSLDYIAFKIKNIDVSKDNYMSGNYFVFNQYKTSRIYGKEKVEIPNKLKTIINKWRGMNPSDYLLINTHLSGPIRSNQVTIMLNNFFGKNVSINMLRHAYLTHKYDNVPGLQEMKETAKAMGHSVETALEYVKR